MDIDLITARIPGVTTSIGGDKENMAKTLPTVFLSLSGIDEKFVSTVHKLLPDGIAHFYPRSFTNGENLVAAMEERVEGISVFILFASKASSKSAWVGFEIDRARLQKIQSPNFRLLVFPVDRIVSHADLPAWVREHWIERAGHSPRDVARYIRNVVETMALSGLKSAQVFGRGALLDAMLIDFQDISLDTHEAPNIFVFAGNDGIGRRTVRREFLQKAFPAMPDLNAGPEIELPQFADIADIYRALRQEIEADFSAIRFQKHDLPIFQGQTTEEQVAEILQSLERFSDLRQAVTLVTGSGLFEDSRRLKSWTSNLFQRLREKRHLKLCVISNRQVYGADLRQHTNAVQFAVGELADPHIRSLMIAYATDRGKAPNLPKPEIITAIGGHPQIAKAAARFIDRQGTGVIDNDPRELFAVQEEILAKCLDFSNLSNTEKDILSVLSWLPYLNSGSLRKCIVEIRGTDPIVFGSTLADLEQACLIQEAGPNYRIASPMRGLFRRKHGYGSSELRRSLATSLKAELDQAKEADRVPTELVNSVVFMASLEGGTFPSEFQDLVLPSTIQEIVQDIYNRRREGDPAGLRQVVAWSSAIEAMTMDEATREEILSYVSRAQSRMGDKAEAQKTLKFIEARAYRSRHFLRAFYLRRVENDLPNAIKHLLLARPVQKYRRAVIADLALCYYRLGKITELQQLLVDEKDHLDNNPALLDIQAAMYIGANQYPEAEVVIRKMRAVRQEDGRADSRTAIIMMQRDHGYPAAQLLLTNLLQGRSGSTIPTRRLRGIAAAHSGDFATAQSDLEWLRSQPGCAFDAFRIEARIFLVQGLFLEATAALDRVKPESRQDKLLLARILEAQADNPATPLSIRQTSREQATTLRRQNRGLSDID